MSQSLQFEEFYQDLERELSQPRSFPFCLIGTDEVGRGPLFGSVVAASVAIIFQSRKEFKEFFETSSERFIELEITDSKKLTQKKREKILNFLELEATITENPLQIRSPFSSSLIFSCCECTPLEIDQLNILHASLKAMEKSVQQVVKTNQKGKIYIDGNRAFPGEFRNWKKQTVIKGDLKNPLISLASIIAKEARDRDLRSLAKKYPHYGLERNSGYPTKEHREGIVKFGITPYHRKTFKGVREFLEEKG